MTLTNTSNESWGNRLFQVLEFQKIEKSRIPVKHLDALQRFDERHAERHDGDTIFDWHYKDYIRAKNWVGVISIPGLTIEILPKISASDSAFNSVRAQKNLLYMLVYSGALPFSLRDLALINFEKAPLLEAFIFLFANDTLSQIQKGLDRAYTTLEAENTQPKGKILLNHTLRMQGRQRLGVYISYSEFNSDTTINRVLKYTCRHLLKRSSSIPTQQKLREIILFLSDVSDVHDIKTALKKIIYTRSNERFKTLISFCTLILGGNNPGVSTGNTETFSLLFPMEQVFESFIGAVIKKNLSEWGFSHHRPYLQYKSGTSHLLHFVNKDGAHKPRIQVRPDIVIEDNTGEPVLVVDTKWKRLSENVDGTRSNASMADIYQVYSYAHHFNCKTNILLYPSIGNPIEHRYHLAASPDKTLLIHQIDFDVDLISDSKAFSEQLKSITEDGLIKRI